MDDYIKRKSAYDALCKICNERDACEHTGQEGCHQVFAQIPTADVRENVRGKWKRFHKKNGDEGYYEWCECSACGEWATAGPCYFDNETPFCPWCGADMRGAK